MRKKTRALLALLRGQMSDWLYSPRTVIMGLVILALAFINAKSFGKIIHDYALTSHMEEAVYTYVSSAFGNLVSISAFFLIMISEIPRRIPAQLNMLIRTSRIKWLSSQLLFCFVVVILMLGFLSLISLLLTIPYLTPGNGWSMRSTDPNMLWTPDFVPEYIRVITPFSANALASVVLFLFWFTMALVILLFSLFGKPNGGLILYVFLLVLSVTLLWENVPNWIRALIPTNYATLANIGLVFPGKELDVLPGVISVYALIDMLLIGAMIIVVRGMDFHFIRKDKF